MNRLSQNKTVLLETCINGNIQSRLQGQWMTRSIFIFCSRCSETNRQRHNRYLRNCGWLLIIGLVDNSLLRRSQAYVLAALCWFVRSVLPSSPQSVTVFLGVVSQGGAKQSCLGGEAILMGGASRPFSGLANQNAHSQNNQLERSYV
jgi:hypothetical protein